MRRFLAGSVFEARDYSSIVCCFSPQNHKLIACYRAAIRKLPPIQGQCTNRIKRLASLWSPTTATLAAPSGAAEGAREASRRHAFGYLPAAPADAHV